MYPKSEWKTFLLFSVFFFVMPSASLFFFVLCVSSLSYSRPHFRERFYDVFIVDDFYYVFKGRNNVIEYYHPSCDRYVVYTRANWSKSHQQLEKFQWRKRNRLRVRVRETKKRRQATKKLMLKTMLPIRCVNNFSIFSFFLFYYSIFFLAVHIVLFSLKLNKYSHVLIEKNSDSH